MGNLKDGDIQKLKEMSIKTSAIPCRGYTCSDCPVRRAGLSKCDTSDCIRSFCLQYLSEHGESTSSGKPVDHFEVGKWYKWVGPKDFHDNWSRDMDAWKDGNQRKCAENRTYATFDGIGNGSWDYRHCMQYFREVPDPTAHDSVSGHPRTLGEVITDKVVGKPDEFNPSSVKSRSQRRAEILHGLTID